MTEHAKPHTSRSGHAHAADAAASHAEHFHDGGTHPGVGHRVKDPVCGMSVDPHTAKHRASYKGQPYYFCSAKCRERFEAEPARYLAPETRPAEPVPEGAIYTCPMHPQI